MIDYNGRRYYRDRQTGYYRTLMRHGDRQYLHRAVWQTHHGNIPHGWEVHHRVADRATIDPGDLECIPFSEHLARHRGDLFARGTYRCAECNAEFTATRRGGRRFCSRRCGVTFHNHLRRADG